MIPLTEEDIPETLPILPVVDVKAHDGVLVGSSAGGDVSIFTFDDALGEWQRIQTVSYPSRAPLRQ